MKKTLKSFKKWYKGYELEPSDLRRIDAVWFEFKCVSLTIIVVLTLLFLLNAFGTFEGTPLYKMKK